MSSAASTIITRLYFDKILADLRMHFTTFVKGEQKIFFLQKCVGSNLVCLRIILLYCLFSYVVVNIFIQYTMWSWTAWFHSPSLNNVFLLNILKMIYGVSYVIDLKGNVLADNPSSLTHPGRNNKEHARTWEFLY